MRRRAVLHTCGAAAIVAAAVACADLSGLSGAAEPAAEGGAEAGPVVDGSLDVADASGPVFEDASRRDDATAVVDPSGCTICDCDGDKVMVSRTGCGGADGGAGDCDDTDPLIKPGSGFVSEVWSSSHMPAGDWDCSGTVVKQFPININCAGGNCASVQGFMNDPPCGALADYFACQQAMPLFPCTAMKIDTRRQACK